MGTNVLSVKIPGIESIYTCLSIPLVVRRFLLKVVLSDFHRNRDLPCVDVPNLLFLSLMLSQESLLLVKLLFFFEKP